MDFFALILSTVFGLLVGSFVNVVAYRLPLKRSVVSPGSACPACGHVLRPWENIPVVSWLLLKGKCSGCQKPISVRYPIVELLTAGVFALLALRVGWAPELPAFLLLGAAGMALALIDLDTSRLPNVITLPMYPISLVLLTAAAAVDGDWWAWRRALIGLVILFGVYFLLAVAYPAGMGFGDVKLSGLLGLHLGWLGWGELAVGAWLGFLGGGVVGIVLMLGGRATRKTPIPFGPFMLLGALAGMMWGGPLARLYLGV